MIGCSLGESTNAVKKTPRHWWMRHGGV